MEKELYINVDRYKIDNNGNIYSNYKGYWEIMKPVVNPSGYLTLGLTDCNGIRKTYFVHRLVFTSFNNLGYLGDYDVHHIDYNKLNCKLDNLKKMTHEENVEDYLVKFNIRVDKKPKNKIDRKSYRIPKEDIINSLNKTKGNFTQSAKDFSMTDNSLRKWCKKYNLPYKSSQWKLYKH